MKKVDKYSVKGCRWEKKKNTKKHTLSLEIFFIAKWDKLKFNIRSIEYSLKGNNGKSATKF